MEKEEVDGRRDGKTILKHGQYHRTICWHYGPIQYRAVHCFLSDWVYE